MFNVVLSFLDSLIGFLPAWGRLTIWAIILGAGTMLGYALFSDQERIAEIKEQAQQAQQRMQEYEGTDFEPFWEMAKEAIGLSFQQMKVMLGPTMMAGVPILIVLVWMEGAYSHRLPEAGEMVGVSVQPAAAVDGEDPSARWEPAGAVTRGDDDGMKLKWPAEKDAVRLVGTGSSADETALVTLPVDHARPRITKKRWDHAFFANPAGYLPAEGPVDRVEIEMPHQRVVPIDALPVWLQTWHVFFLTVLSIAAIAVKVGFDID